MYRSRHRLGIVKLCTIKDLDPKRPKHKWCLYAKKGRRVLGRHLNRKAAHRQEVAIKISQKRASR